MALDSNSSSNSPHDDDVPNSNTQQQQPSMFHWPYFPQSATQAPWQQQQLPHPQQGTRIFRPPQLFGPNIPTIFQTFNGNGWQEFPVASEATSSTTHNLVLPNMCYHAGYTFPGFPGLSILIYTH